jgi:acetyl-CoA carboxylase biotin carboxyl carrier protein
MSLERIKQLLGLMDEHDLVEMEVEEKDFKLRLKKPGAVPPPAPAYTVAPPPAAGPASAPAAAPAPEDDPGLHPVKSPIVGTFYRSPSPEADPFVQAGTTVGEETIICIVEAMKIMNEIKAGVSGTVEKILVENGEPVEYGQTLFLVRV